MIQLSNGVEFDFCCASGALAFDGRGWPWDHPFRWAGLLDPKSMLVVAKTVTAAPMRGNLRWWHPWTCVRLLSGEAAVNAVGLSNPGIEEWAARHYPTAVAHGYQLAASVKADTVDEAREMARRLRVLDALAYIEVNLSCPNAQQGERDAVGDILEALREAGRPLIAKLSADQVNPYVVGEVGPHVEAIHAINTIPWGDVHPGCRSPLERYRHGLKGGVSGPPIRGRALEAVRYLSGLTDRPIVGGGGISSLEDVLAFERAGASAFSVGTLFLRRPWEPNRIIRAYRGGGPARIRPGRR